MYLSVAGKKRDIYYHKPRLELASAGVTSGMLLFSGTVHQDGYEGTAYTFSQNCGARSYPVSGRIEEAGGRVVMTGFVKTNAANCEAPGVEPLTLNFLYWDAEVSNYFGAIAYSPKTQSYGYGVDLPSNDTAQTVALSNCTRSAGDCVVVVYFRNGCGALAIGKDGYGGGWGIVRRSPKATLSRRARSKHRAVRYDGRSALFGESVSFAA